MPRPSPFEAPRTRPAISTKFDLGRNDFRGAGDLRRSRSSADPAPRLRRHSARWCKTDSSPPAPRAVCVRALKRVDLPTFGRPTIPHLKPIFDPLICVQAAGSGGLTIDRPWRAARGVRGSEILRLARRRAIQPHSEIASSTASTQGYSSLAKSFSTWPWTWSLLTGTADADPHPHIVVAAMSGNRTQAVVSGVAAAGLHAHFRRGEVDLVVEHGDVAELDLEEVLRFARPSARNRS